MNRIPSDNSIKTLSADTTTSPPKTQTSATTSSNLRDELLNCEQKELFQFLHEDFDNSNNYFSDTVGFGAVVDPDTDSLMFEGPVDDSLLSDRKVSSGSLRSNLSSISNSIFHTLEMRRGGSFSGSIDKVINRIESPALMRKRLSDNASQKDMEREPLVGNSDFDCLIESFDKSLTDLKKDSSSMSLDRNGKYLASSANPEDHSKSNSSSNSAPDTVIRRAPRAFDRTSSSSVKLKRRSLEKQNKVLDEEFEGPQTQQPTKDGVKSPSNNGSPTMRIRRSFNNSYDRIKRSSLIERVEEENEGERSGPLRVESEKLPRKEFRINDEKKHRSDENLKQQQQQQQEQVCAVFAANILPSHDVMIGGGSRKSVSHVDAIPQNLHTAVVVDSPSKSEKSSKSGKSSNSSKKSKKSKKSPKSGKGTVGTKQSLA